MRQKFSAPAQFVLGVIDEAEGGRAVKAGQFDAKKKRQDRPKKKGWHEESFDAPQCSYEAVDCFFLCLTRLGCPGGDSSDWCFLHHFADLGQCWHVLIAPAK